MLTGNPERPFLTLQKGQQTPNDAKRIRRVYGKYGSNIMFLQDVYEIDEKYYDPIFLKFWEVYCRIYRSLMTELGGDDSSIVPDIDTGDEIPGITINETDDDHDDNDGSEDDEHYNARSQSPEQSVLDIIKRLNEKEELTAEEIKKWKDEIFMMFDTFKQNQSFMAKLRDDNFSSEQKLREYYKVLNKYRLSLNHRSDIGKVQLLKQLLQNNSEQLLDVFLDAL